MSLLNLTKTRMLEGMWQGIITGAGDTKPDIAVSHANTNVPDFQLFRDEAANHWVLTIPVPATAVADGIQTILIVDRLADVKIGEIVLIGDDLSNGGLQAEMELLRAELDMLKRAFRRHCLETA
jgi:hypothetical protein